MNDAYSPWFVPNYPHEIVDDPEPFFTEASKLVSLVNSNEYNYPITPLETLDLRFALSADGGTPLVCSKTLLDKLEKVTDQTIDNLHSKLNRVETKTVTKSYIDGITFSFTGDNFVNGTIWALDDNDYLVGGISDGNIWVDPKYRQHGIGSEMIIIAFKYGIKRVNEMAFYSPSGLCNRIRAYHKAKQRS